MLTSPLQRYAPVLRDKVRLSATRSDAPGDASGDRPRLGRVRGHEWSSFSVLAIRELDTQPIPVRRRRASSFPVRQEVHPGPGIADSRNGDENALVSSSPESSGYLRRIARVGDQAGPSASICAGMQAAATAVSIDLATSSTARSFASP